MFCTICLVNQCQACSWGRRWFVLTQAHSCFANGTTLTHFFHSFRKRFQVQYHTSEIFYRNFLTHGKRCLFPEKSVRVSTWRRLLLQNVAMVAKKLLVDDKITACVKQISWVLYAKFRIEKRLVKHFAFLKNVCYQYLHFLLRVTQLRAADWPQPTFLECIVTFL